MWKLNKLRTKLLVVTLDFKLSWSKHIDTTVAKMGRSPSIIKRCSTFLTTLSTRQVLQALVLSHLDYCSVVPGATKRDLGNVQLTQNRAARLALECSYRSNINNMHVNLSWLKGEERLTSSLLVFMGDIDILNALSCLSKLLAQLRHPCTPHKTCHQRSLHSPSPEQTMGGAQYCTTWLHGTLFHIS